MADEVEMTPVEMTPVDAAEPPKVNPLAKPASDKPATISLKPVPRKPEPGTAVSGLKPGLKLPPKPGATASALRPGLKLPPKPGSTVSALRPGLKLPPKPGATVSALKPGLKLPPKPGATASALRPGLKLPPKPGVNKPDAATPAAPAIAKPVAVDAQGVGKLPTVESKAIARDDVAPSVPPPPNPLEQLKSVTQRLKGVTQEIPQQAILRKTGIIADSVMSDSQKEAAKHKTARISLSDAMGVAPVKNENAPLKTIRIKRPLDLPGSTSSTLKPLPKPVAPAAAPAAPAAAAASETPPAEAATTVVAAEPAKPAAPTVTQRKTLKIARPGGAVRPAGKFGVRRPSSATSAPTVVHGAAAAPAAESADGAVADIPDIADIPSMPAPNIPPVAVADNGPTWAWTLSSLVQAAACVAIGVLAWMLYQNTQTMYF